MKPTLRTISTVGFATIFGLMSVIGCVSFYSLVQLRSEIGWVDHTLEVLRELEALRKSIDDLQRGELGYVLTGEESYLEPHSSAMQSTPAGMARLRKLTEDNPAQQRRLDSMSPMLHDLLAFFTAVVEKQKDEGSEAAKALIGSGTGKKLLDEADGVITDMIGEEMRLLKAREDSSRRGILVTQSVIVAGNLFAIGIVAIALILLGREYARRDRAEALQAASEFRYRRLFEAAQDGILILDGESGAILDANPFLIGLLGFSLEGLVGKKLFELGFFEDIVASQDAFAELQRNELIRYEDKPLKTADGRQIDVEFVSLVYLLDGKKVIHCTIHDISERVQAEKAQRASEIQYRRLFEAAKDGILILDAETGMVVGVNPFLVELLGFSKEEFLDKKVYELGFFKDIVANEANFAELQQNEYIRYEDKPLEAADGHRIEVEFISNVYLVNGRKVIQCNIRDISERNRLNRIYRMLSKTNEMIVRVLQREALLEGVAQIAVEQGKVQFAWIGVVQADGQVIPVARAGNDYGYIDQIRATIDPMDPRGQGPTGQALREKKVVVTNDFLQLEKTAPWHEAARAARFGASAVFPLFLDGHIFGTLNLYASEGSFFEEREIATIEEMARDVSFALDNLQHAQERVQAANALHESEKQFRVLFENFVLGIVLCEVVLDEQGIPVDCIYLSANPAVEVHSGVSVVQLVGHRASDVLSPAEVAALVARYGRVALGGEAERFEEDLPSLNRRLELGVFHLSGLRVAVIFEDVTDKYAADEKLRMQAAVMEATANGIVITDLQGTIEWANAAFVALTGFSTQEAVGKNPRELIRSGLHDKAFFRNLWETIRAGLVWQGEITNRRKDGTLYTEMQTITPIRDRAGEIKHFAGVKVDITDRKKLEQELVQAQKMESVGRLAGGVAHDFNNLLTIISGYTEMALGHVKEDDHLHADLTQVYKAAERAASLTRQLLAFSRRQVLRPEILDLNQTLADCTKMLQRLIGEDVSFVLKPGEGLWRVLADPGQIEQIIMNLVVNARDAMPLGGSVILETQNVDLDDDIHTRHDNMQSGCYVCLAVSDTGTGMDAATQKQLFEPFFTTKGVGKGTGLGLATVYGIVKQSGGSIFVYSEVGKGTTFKIYLPQAVVVEPTQRVDAGKAVIPRGAETILLVEDEEPLRVLAERFLTKAGYTVFSASNGAEALALVEREHAPVHLVLTDVIMPEMSGRELVNRLTEKHPGFKILYMSGYTDTAIAVHGVLEGGTQLLGKPFTALQLTRKVREVLDE